MIKNYIELRLFSLYQFPFIVLAAIMGVALLISVLILVANSWEKRQQRLIDEYFEDEEVQKDD